jgi:hypothetical protein
MPNVALSNRALSKWIIASALLLGVIAGLFLTRGHAQEYDFLKGTKPIAVRDGSVVTSSGVVRGNVTYYSFEGDWQRIYELAKAEMPDAIERDTTIGGAPAKVLTIPRMENGRKRVFFPPVREVTILPQRLVLSEGGQLMAQEQPGRAWASIKISEYHQPHILESAVDWFRDHIDI